MKEDYLDHEQKNAMSIGLNLNDDQKMIFAKALKNAKEDVLHSPKKLSFNLGITQKPDRQVKDLINQDESQTKNNILENVAKKVLNIREETTPLKQNKTRTNKDTIIKSQTSLMNLSVKDKVQQSLNSNLEFIDVKKDPEALRQMIEESKQFYVRQFQKQMVSLVKEKKKGKIENFIYDYEQSYKIKRCEIATIDKNFEKSIQEYYTKKSDGSFNKTKLLQNLYKKSRISGNNLEDILPLSLKLSKFKKSINKC